MNNPDRDSIKEALRNLLVSIFQEIYGKNSSKKIDEFFKKGIMIDSYVDKIMKIFDRNKEFFNPVKTQVRGVNFMKYKCEQCSAIFDIEWNLDYVQGNLPKCPVCGSIKTERVNPQDTLKNRRNKRDGV